MAARVLVWVLHVCHPRLAQEGQQVVVEGFVAFPGRASHGTRKNWESRAKQLWQLQLPGLPPAVLQLRLREV